VCRVRDKVQFDEDWTAVAGDGGDVPVRPHTHRRQPGIAVARRFVHRPGPLAARRIVLRDVLADHRRRRPRRLNAAGIQQNRSRTERLNGVDVVADEKHRAAIGAGDRSHLAEALLLEFRVADREYLVDDQNLGLEMRGDGEGQSDVHAAAEALDGCVEKLLDFGERHDLVEFAADLGTGHAEDRAIDEDVLAASKLGMKSRAHLEQAGDPAVQRDAALGRLGDAAENLQQRALARPVPADDADDIPLEDVDINILEGPEMFVVLEPAVTIPPPPTNRR
jgi:hypothetical protein